MRRSLLIVALALLPAVAGADKTKKTAEGAAKTSVDAVVDGGRLVGRTTANGRATRAAAHEK